MTALSRQRTKLLIRPGLWLAAAAILSACLQPMSGVAAVTERVVTDPLTGLAISGFDPVAYFTDGSPKLGLDSVEYRSDGVMWRFRNEGNRAAFAADPHIYRPRFGGYDPIAVGRGVGTAGHPEIWTIYNKRLYLFYNAKARETFLADPDAATRNADERWVDVLRTLVP